MHSFMSSLTTASQPTGVHLCYVILYIFLTWTIAQDSRKEKAANTIKYENLEKVHHLSNNKKKTNLSKSCIRIFNETQETALFECSALALCSGEIYFSFLSGCFHQSYKRISKFMSAVKIETSSPLNCVTL